MPPDPTWFMPYSLPPKGTGDDWSPMDGFEWVPVGDGNWQLVGPDGMPVGPPVQFPEGVDPNVDDGDPDYTPGGPSEFETTPDWVAPGGLINPADVVAPTLPDSGGPEIITPGGLPDLQDIPGMIPIPGFGGIPIRVLSPFAR